MNCRESHAKMLIAEPNELRGIGETSLARHVASCDGCQAAATRLSRDLDQLSAAVIRTAPRRRAQSARNVALLAGIPIAASLVVGITVLAHREKPVLQPAVAPASARVVSVDVARGQRATVFNTNDPNITVVWLSPGGDP